MSLPAFLVGVGSKGLSVAAKETLKQLKRLIGKTTKTSKDRKEISKLKDKLKNDSSVKQKKLANEKRKIKERRKDKETKQEIGDIKSAIVPAPVPAPEPNIPCAPANVVCACCKKG